jgi:hypothetical protein
MCIRDREHPVRGQLNDPRMQGHVFDSSDSHTFHSGVDVVAPDGTAVYAVEPGYVHRINATAIAVRGKRGAVIFGYWHIRPVVKNGKSVRLHALLGYIEPGRWHVHLSEKRSGRYVNPLRPSGLTPCSDKTRPTIASISYYDGAYHELTNTTLSGAVRITVNAYDTPSLATNWPWAVVTPARIGWQLFDESGLKVTSGRWDFRYAVFALDPVEVFAPGTLTNSSRGAGSYNYWIGPEWDTTLALNGAYWLVVTAADIRGNATTKIVSFAVANAPASSDPASPAPATSPATSPGAAT